MERLTSNYNTHSELYPDVKKCGMGVEVLF